MNRPVAVAAERNRSLHLLAREVLFEPLVAVASTGNQVMLGGAALRYALA